MNFTHEMWLSWFVVTDESILFWHLLLMKVVLQPREYLWANHAASGYGDSELGPAYSFLPIYLMSPIMPINV